MLIPDIRSENNSPTNSVGDFVKWWNVNFPLDRWYRKKHKITWGSERHREVTLLSIYFEYEEERLFKEVGENLNKESTHKYAPGDWFNSEGQQITEESTEDLFDKIDLSSISETGEVEIDLD